MKRLLAMLTALMLCAGCCAAFAQTGHEREEFLGYWELTEIRLMGMTLPANAAERKGFISFHEDDTAIFCLDQDAGRNVNVIYADGVAKLDDARNITCAIGADGKLSCKLAADGISLDLVYTRMAYPALPALMASWPGEYELVSVTLGSQSMPASALVQYTMQVYEDGFGVFTLGNQTATFCMWEENGVIRGIDAEGEYFDVRLDEQGQLRITMLSQGLEIVGRPLKAAQPAGAETPVAENPFLGQWESVGVSLMGMEFGMDDLGLGLISLRVEQDMAYLVLGDESGSCPTSYEGDTLVFTNGTERLDCTLEDGWMYMAMTVDGLTLRVKMQRAGESVAEVAEVPAEEPAAAADFEGTWRPQVYLLLGMELPADALDMSVTLTIADGTATMAVDGEKVTCRATYDGNTCTLVDSTGDVLLAVLGEDGLLSVDLESDGIVMTMKMVREGGAPVVEPPIVEEPVTGETVVEKPAADEPAAEVPVAEEGFDGMWTLVQVERRDGVASAAQLGLSGSLEVMGSSARYTFGMESMLGLVAEDGTTLRVVGRSTYDFVLNAQGLLTLPATVDGEAVVLRFSRDGMPVAETPVVEESEAETDADVAPAAAEGFDGVWTLVQVDRHGSIVPASQLGLSGSLTVTGSSARYILGSENILGLVSATETGLTVVARGGSMQFTLENGYLCRQTLMDGDTVVLCFYRGEMPAEQPSDEPASGFDGAWHGVSAMVMGMDFSLEELGMTVLELELSGSSGFLTDENGRRAVGIISDEGRLILTEGASRWVFSVDAQGKAVLEMTREGITVQVLMKKAEGTSVVQPAAEPVPVKAVCDFCHAEHDAAQSRTVVGMTVCPTCYSRYFE